ncbi:GIY-YIG nuclease family protein [Achromobacter sp. K91]|uniref:GIY-YIG nuclease family protein n=1 Tax=Achromobacter sp. K91 TaxID=2292262 RepID=UPI000E65F555|nr:GIY-YIG nuclease family protein [Achromobacter sp. K91]RIJ00925.1 GIY-YIG nuclease family protein [Achromobacter sp. K91]
MSTLSIVYVLSNPAMPGLVKIGYTAAPDANARIGQLYTTGVPVPFKLEYACRTANPEQVERALHEAFGPNRLNPKREFFQIGANQAIAILKLLHVGEDVTEEVEQQPTAPDVDQASIAAGERLEIRRRPKLSFDALGIPVGAQLAFVRDPAVTATIEPGNKVRLHGDVMSLTRATRKALKLPESAHDRHPAPLWNYEERNLADIYDEFHGEDETTE